MPYPTQAILLSAGNRNSYSLPNRCQIHQTGHATTLAALTPSIAWPSPAAQQAILLKLFIFTLRCLPLRALFSFTPPAASKASRSLSYFSFAALYFCR